MTHDELLARVIGISKENVKFWPNLEIFLTPNTKALRAVVELHKPTEVEWADEEQACSHCSTRDWDIYYPCETIQAIEKELA